MESVIFSKESIDKICGSNLCLTIGKKYYNEYNILSGTFSVYIKDDNDEYKFYPIEYFISLQEHRSKILDLLL